MGRVGVQLIDISNVCHGVCVCACVCVRARVFVDFVSMFLLPKNQISVNDHPTASLAGLVGRTNSYGFLREFPDLSETSYV